MISFQKLTWYDFSLKLPKKAFCDRGNLVHIYFNMTVMNGHTKIHSKIIDMQITWHCNNKYLWCSVKNTVNLIESNMTGLTHWGLVMHIYIDINEIGHHWSRYIACHHLFDAKPSPEPMLINLSSRTFGTRFTEIQIIKQYFSFLLFWPQWVNCEDIQD